MTRKLKVRILAALGVPLGLVLACVSTPRVEPIHTEHAAAVHAVHNRHIAKLMKSISHSHSRVQPFRLPLVQERNRDYKTIEGCVKEIIGSADLLRDFAVEEQLSEESRAMFGTLVDTLSERAQELRDAAGNRDKSGVKRAFAQLTATCNTCHSAFREPIQQHHERKHLAGAKGE